MGKKKPSGGRRPGDVTDQIGAALAYAKLFGDKAASLKFGFSCRTLERRRAQIAQGSRPDLAEIVEQNAKIAAKHCRDLLTDTYEAALKALLSRIQTTAADDRMTDYNLIGAIGILGSQRMTRDMLADDAEDEPTERDSGGEAADQAPNRAPGATPGPPGLPVH